MDFLQGSEVDLAYKILSQAGETMYYKDLVLNVIEQSNKPVQSLPVAISEVYTLINMDSRFQYAGHGHWGLTEWVPPDARRSHGASRSASVPKSVSKASRRKEKLFESIQE